MNRYRKRKHSKITMILTAAAVMLLLLSGTYAWQDYSQHKSNEFSEGDFNVYDVTLVENFEEVTDWKVADGPITQRISVKNTGTAGNGGPVYVRVQLKEYMELAKKTEDSYSGKRYLIDSSGEFVKFDENTYGNSDPTAALAALNAYAATNFSNEYEFEAADLELAQGYFDDQAYWYVITKGGDPNGQYGKFLLLKSGYADMESLVPGVERSYDAYDPEKHHLHRTGECDYTVHLWDPAADDQQRPMSCDYGFHDYVTWHLGSRTTPINGWDGFEFKSAGWYLDTTDGWAYWGEPLEPGEATDYLIEAVQLTAQPPGTFYYAIHADMEAISVDEPSFLLKSEAPFLYSPINGPAIVNGEGIAGSTIRVVFPDGTQAFTTVEADNTWTLDNSGITANLVRGETVTAYQTEKGKLESDPVTEVVAGSNI